MAWELPPEAEPVLKPILKRQESAERRHRNYRKKWNRLYSLYRSHAEFRNWYQTADRPDRDIAVKDLQRDQGAELFISHSFEVVETTLPRMVSNRPRILIQPRGDTDEVNAENMRLIIDGQQEQAHYPITLQETAKSGLIYGLGVEKSYWRTELYPVPVLAAGVTTPLIESTRMCGHDDPDCENVDIFDFYWDPFAATLDRARWAIHRTWRDTDYVMRALIQGRWNNPFGFPPSEALSDGSEHFDTIHKQRLASAGQDDITSGDDRMHEVWEYHDGKQLVLVLNRRYPVHVGPKPYPHHGLPFVAARPTTQGIRELPGIGEIEPIEHLQYEMNSLRSMRMDNAKFAVNRTFAYRDGLVDPDDLRVGPGMAIPVNGDPRELLFPLPIQDVPGSSYQEEDRLLADIQRITGISDTVTGASSAGETATGVQMVQAAASIRIQNKTYRLEKEAIEGTGRIWLCLNQWHIRNNRTIPIPAAPEPGDVERKWAQREVGPMGLAGEMFLTADGGATAPENPGEKMQRAMMLQQMYRGDPGIRQPELYRETLRMAGVKHPDAWLAPQGPDGVAVLQVLEQMGMPRDQVAKVAEEADLLKQQEGQQAAGTQPQAPA